MLLDHAAHQLGHVSRMAFMLSRTQIGLLNAQQLQMPLSLRVEVLTIKVKAWLCGTHLLHGFLAALIKMLF